MRNMINNNENKKLTYNQQCKNIKYEQKRKRKRKEKQRNNLV